jgi:hypothetical protein
MGTGLRRCGRNEGLDPGAFAEGGLSGNAGLLIILLN